MVLFVECFAKYNLERIYYLFASFFYSSFKRLKAIFFFSLEGKLGWDCRLAVFIQ